MSSLRDYQNSSHDLMPRERLIWLMDLLIEGKLTVDKFCSEYEHTWNFEINENDLSFDEAQIFEEVFDVVAWYTPINEDRKSYPGFKDEASVLEAVKNAKLRLTENKT